MGYAHGKKWNDEDATIYNGLDQQQRKNRQAYEISGFLRQNVLFEEAYGSQEDQISEYLRPGYYERIENKEIDKREPLTEAEENEVVKKEMKHSIVENIREL